MVPCPSLCPLPHICSIPIPSVSHLNSLLLPPYLPCLPPPLCSCVSWLFQTFELLPPYRAPTLPCACPLVPFVGWAIPPAPPLTHTLLDLPRCSWLVPFPGSSPCHLLYLPTRTPEPHLFCASSPFVCFGWFPPLPMIPVCLVVPLPTDSFWFGRFPRLVSCGSQFPSFVHATCQAPVTLPCLQTSPLLFSLGPHPTPTHLTVTPHLPCPFPHSPA